MVTPPPMSDEPSAEMRRVQRAIAYCFTAMPERMAQAEIICGVNVVGTLWDFSEELARAAILAMQATQPTPAMEGRDAAAQKVYDTMQGRIGSLEAEMLTDIVIAALKGSAQEEQTSAGSDAAAHTR